VTVRTYIVDDEVLARDRIRSLLERDPDIEICGEANNGDDAVTGIRELKPDLLFLDVQMPGTDGFGVLRSLAESPTAPIIVFVTAYDRYAVEAFTACALDFLLKPFNRPRFEQAVNRAKAAVRSRDLQAEFRSRLLNLLSDVCTGSGFSSRIVVKVDGKHVFVPVTELRWIQAEGDYARLHLSKRSYLIRERMNTVESKLDPARFIRIHRSTIVNLDHILEAHTGVGGDYIVRLDDGTDLSVSRSYRASLQKYLDQAL
jgi:two-component system LytT family response regulator